MTGFTDAIEQALLDHFLNDPAYTPESLYLGLSSTTPTEAGANFTEPTSGSYARVATTNADWNAASGTAPAIKDNSAVKTFPTATADWVSGSNLTHFGLFNASARVARGVAGVSSAASAAIGALTVTGPSVVALAAVAAAAAVCTGAVGITRPVAGRTAAAAAFTGALTVVGAGLAGRVHGPESTPPGAVVHTAHSVAGGSVGAGAGVGAIVDHAVSLAGGITG